jgi:hypothetical protein
LFEIFSVPATEPLHPTMHERFTPQLLERPTIVTPSHGSKGKICPSGAKTMREPGVQRDRKNEATIISAPLAVARKPHAPIAALSPTKRTALIECLNNNGLHKRNGYWWGTLEGKHISGVTVADLARDGMFSVIKNLRHSSARLTERGQRFARTLIVAANEVPVRE